MYLESSIEIARVPKPKITNLQAQEVLEVYYDIHGNLRFLGGQDYLKYQLEADFFCYVLVVYHGDYPVHELHAQLDALKCLKSHTNIRQHAPRVIPAECGRDLLSLDIAGHLMHFCLFKCAKGTLYS